MGLDIMLHAKTGQYSLPTSTGSGIFVRENGATKEISLLEWNLLYPGSVPVTFTNSEPDENQEWMLVFESNITHNLNKMADEANIYKELWRPEEIDVKIASQLIEPLKNGLMLLKAEPERFKALNPENGWGNYEGLISFVTNYLEACQKYPDAEIMISR